MTDDYQKRRALAMQRTAEAQQAYHAEQARLASIDQLQDSLQRQAVYFNETGRTKPPEIAERMAATAEERRRTENRLQTAQRDMADCAAELDHLQAEATGQERPTPLPDGATWDTDPAPY